MIRKGPEDIERCKVKPILSTVSLPGLAEADEAETPTRRSGDAEVAGHVLGFQVFVVFTAINDLPLLSIGRSLKDP